MHSERHSERAIETVNGAGHRRRLRRVVKTTGKQFTDANQKTATGRRTSRQQSLGSGMRYRASDELYYRHRQENSSAPRRPAAIIIAPEL
jgi:hypothetical protein